MLRRLAGDVELVTGPKMLLPDPRTQVVVRRVLSQKMVKLLYPGNEQALQVNAALEEAAQDLPAGAHFTQDVAARGLLRSATRASAAETMQRGTTYTPPRTITLATKFDGAVRVDIWTGYAVLVTDSTGNRRVVVGPKTILLEYDENLASMELSTGTPKVDKPVIETVYLRVLNNRVSDQVVVETADLCRISLQLSYRVNFEGEDRERWFAVENYVKFLTEHLRSLVRNTARQHGVEKFYRDAINIVRDAVLGAQQDSRRPGRSFSENGMRVYDVEVLDVKIENADIEKLLTDTQHATFKAALTVAAAERELENTTRIQAARRGGLQELFKTTELESGLEVRKIKATLNRVMAQIKAEGDQATERNRFKLEDQQVLGQITEAELARAKADADQRLSLKKEEIQAELVRLHGESEEHVKRVGAVTPQLAAALQAFADNHLIEKAAEAMAVQTLIGGKSIVETLKQLLDGTPLAGIMSGLATRRDKSPTARS